MATKRVTDERREKMSVRAARCYALHMETPDVSIDNAYPDLLHDYTTDVDDLLHDYATVEAENQRLRAEIAAMRPMVALVARGCVDEATIGFPEFIVALDGDDSASEMANAESLIEEAQQFVAAHPAAGEAESEGE